MVDDIQFELQSSEQISPFLKAEFPQLVDESDGRDGLIRGLMIANYQGSVAGVGVISYQPRFDACLIEEVYLSVFEVAANYRGKGVAKALLNAVEAYAATMSSTLRVNCVDLIGSKEMQRLLESADFKSPSSSTNQKTTQWVKYLLEPTQELS